MKKTDMEDSIALQFRYSISQLHYPDKSVLCMRIDHKTGEIVCLIGEVWKPMKFEK